MRTDRVIPLSRRSAVVLTLASIAGLIMFAWPLFVVPPEGAESITPPFVLLALMPVVVLVVIAEISSGK